MKTVSVCNLAMGILELPQVQFEIWFRDNLSEIHRGIVT